MSIAAFLPLDGGQRIDLLWRVGFSDTPDAPPAEWISAQVPGAVQLDFARARGWPPVETAGRPEDYQWMESKHWWYQTGFPPLTLRAGERLVVCLGGIDYAAQVRVNGQSMGRHMGMFRPFELDLTRWAASGGTLEVVLDPAPLAPGSAPARRRAHQAFKPAVSYGWDFHPRLITLGLWREATLSIRPPFEVTHVEPLASIDASLTRGTVELRTRWTGDRPAGCGVVWRCVDPDGSIIHQQELQAPGVVSIPVDNPRLWWPHTHGRPCLYTSIVEVVDSTGHVHQRHVRRVGFRRIRLVMNEGAWQQPAGHVFPKTRSCPPMQLEVNNQPLFVKGSNFVSPDIFPGRLTRQSYEPIIDRACRAHQELLRCWGGAVVPTDDFFDLCDQRGILVWQEFPLACQCYDDHPDYLAVLDADSKHVIERLRHRACLAIWCGGNELFNSWSRMHDQHLALRMLNRNTLDLDPGRPFLPTSPIYGVGHGSYLFRLGDGREVHQYIRQASCTAYTEMGCPGPAPLSMIEPIIPPEQRSVEAIRPGSVWEARHAVRAWDGSSASWLECPTITHYFGPSSSLRELLECGELLQAEGCKALIESARRHKPHASMALLWCFNEPWPSAANNSVLSWPDQPKAGYPALAAACRPTLASAALERFAYRPGETLAVQLWLLHDGLAPREIGLVQPSLRLGAATLAAPPWHVGRVEANSNLAGPIVQWTIPDHNGLVVGEIRLEVHDQPELGSMYRVLVAPA